MNKTYHWHSRMTNKYLLFNRMNRSNKPCDRRQYKMRKKKFISMHISF